MHAMTNNIFPILSNAAAGVLRRFDGHSSRCRTLPPAVLSGAFFALLLCCADGSAPSCPRIERPPLIDPDLSGTVIPPNIAPLNFAVREGASRYRVTLSAPNGPAIRINSAGPVNITVRRWRTLLMANRGGTLTIDVCGKKDGAWRRFNPVTARIATETIDPVLVYRKILGYKSIPDMEIRQRDLTGFKDKTVLSNRTISQKSLYCINCHSFCNGRPDRMIIHMRGEKQGMLLVIGKKIVKLDTRTKFNKGPASYASWHPSGNYLAFAVMKVTQSLHSTGDPRVVFDESSDLILYNVATNTVSTSPPIADPRRMETLPEWSPDGRYLYFCSAPQPPKVDAAFYSALKYREIKYDLMRIPFDPSTETWGLPETLLSAKETGMSNVQPKVSPDGRYLLFVKMSYGYFAVYDDRSDLFLMDLSTRSCRRLDAVNSGFAESFHSWSSNGRWFVFNSRRRDGICGIPYFAHVDSAGTVSKPFILPQRDPAFYDTYLKSFNIPVLAREPVSTDWQSLSKAADDSAAEKSVLLDPRIPADDVTGATTRKNVEDFAP